MKVRISYTMDHEEVPALLDDLISQCRKKLSSCADFRFDLHNLGKTTKTLEDVFVVLDTVQDQLQDCLSLATGLSQALETVEKPTDPAHLPSVIVNEAGAEIDED
jgi:hypothetical protein